MWIPASIHCRATYFVGSEDWILPYVRDDVEALGATLDVIEGQGHFRVLLRGGRAGAGRDECAPRAVNRTPTASARAGLAVTIPMADTEEQRLNPTQSLLRGRPRLRREGASAIALLSLIVALAAVGVAAWAIVMAWPEKRTQPSAESKQKVCAAFDTVSRAVQLQTHANLGPDPIAQTAVASNARLALIGGGEYLVSRLDDQTPPGWPTPFDRSRTTWKTSGSTPCRCNE